MYTSSTIGGGSQKKYGNAYQESSENEEYDNYFYGRDNSQANNLRNANANNSKMRQFASNYSSLQQPQQPNLPPQQKGFMPQSSQQPTNPSQQNRQKPVNVPFPSSNNPLQQPQQPNYSNELYNPSQNLQEFQNSSAFGQFKQFYNQPGLSNGPLDNIMLENYDNALNPMSSPRSAGGNINNPSFGAKSPSRVVQQPNAGPAIRNAPYGMPPQQTPQGMEYRPNDNVMAMFAQQSAQGNLPHSMDMLQQYNNRSQTPSDMGSISNTSSTASTPRNNLIAMQGSNPTGSILPVSNTPATGVLSALADDKYGLLGLKNVIKNNESDYSMLSLGFDLTMLGLNLNSADYLYSTFASPWNTGPSRIIPDFKLPECYQVQMTKDESYFNKFRNFSDETLFYLFYSMPKDILQLAAAKQLEARKWKYHMEHKIWYKLAPSTEVLQQTPTFEIGSYIYFDINVWKMVKKDNMQLFYKDIYNSGGLMVGGSMQQQQQQPQRQMLPSQQQMLLNTMMAQQQQQQQLVSSNNNSK